MSQQDLLIVAGEASGDLHGARLLARLKEQCPQVRAFGLGGDELAASGFEPLAHSSEIAVVGITEALKILPRARQIFDSLLAECARRQARTAILIDAPDFNLRLAKQLKRRGLRVIYYISPQVWAWRKRRVKAIARDVDLMLVLFPFEVEFYRSHGIEAKHVGHPLVDEVPQLEQVWDRGEPEADEPIRIALMPGSRVSEVRALLPTMLRSAELIAADLTAADQTAADQTAADQAAKQRPVVEVCLIAAPTVPSALFDELLASSELLVERVTQQRFDSIAQCHLALCASGTATLEVALLGTPMLVLYRLKWTSYWLGKMLVNLPFFCMVNLVLNRAVVPELLQSETEPKLVAGRALRLLGDVDKVAEMRRNMADLRPALGDRGASRRAAAAVAEVLRIDAEEAAH